jgi:hypothetical protein
MKDSFDRRPAVNDPDVGHRLRQIQANEGRAAAPVSSQTETGSRSKIVDPESACAERRDDDADLLASEVYQMTDLGFDYAAYSPKQIRQVLKTLAHRAAGNGARA